MTQKFSVMRNLTLEVCHSNNVFFNFVIHQTPIIFLSYTNLQTNISQDYDMARGQSLPARSLPPTHPLNSNYGVADSWV